MKALEFLQTIVELGEHKYHGGRIVEFSSEDFTYMREIVEELEKLQSQLTQYKKLANELKDELNESGRRHEMPYTQRSK